MQVYKERERKFKTPEPQSKISKQEQIEKTQKLLSEAYAYVQKLQGSEKLKKNLDAYKVSIEGAIVDNKNPQISDQELIETLKSFDERIKDYTHGWKPDPPTPQSKNPKQDQIEKTQKLLSEAYEYLSLLPGGDKLKKNLDVYKLSIDGTISENVYSEISDQELIQILTSFDERIINKRYTGGRRKSRKVKRSHKRKTRRHRR